MSENNKWSVIKIVQEMLAADVDKSAVNISKKIDLVLQIMPEKREGLDRQAVIDELVRRYSVWVGDNSTLINNEGHVQWLTPERKRSEEHTSELQSRENLVCRLLLEKKKTTKNHIHK